MKMLSILLSSFVMLSCNNEEKKENVAPTVQQDTVVKKQDTVPVAAAEVITDSVAYVRQKVEAINKSKLDKKHVQFECDATTQVDKYYRNGELVKIVVDFGNVGDVYAREDYYYDAGKLIFKYEFVESGPACDDCIETNEYRSYVMNGKVFKYLKNKTPQPCRTCEFADHAKENRLFGAEGSVEMKKVICNY